MLLLTECVTSNYVLGFSYHILPAFSFDVGLQWDSMASTAYNDYKSIGPPVDNPISYSWCGLTILLPLGVDVISGISGVAIYTSLLSKLIMENYIPSLLISTFKNNNKITL